MLIRYGTIEHNIDVTSICHANLRDGDFIIIPSGDFDRAAFFSDPAHGKLKSVFIDLNGETTTYDHTKRLCISVSLNKIMDNIPSTFLPVAEKLNQMHAQLKLNYGSFEDELPEQQMAVRYLTGSETILEIGGNIGRNSLIISHILGKRDANLVVMECDIGIARQLEENRDINKMSFNIEKSALSKRKLIQQGWDTLVSDIVLPGYKPVDVITYSELLQKYKITFDTLVLDCEGAFYYILQDMPEILDSINLILMENDYRDIAHKQYIDSVLKANNFSVVYSQGGGWGPCEREFFQAWKRTN